MATFPDDNVVQSRNFFGKAEIHISALLIRKIGKLGVGNTVISLT